jgi:hypothetical protein
MSKLVSIERGDEILGLLHMEMCIFNIKEEKLKVDEKENF